MRVFKKTFSVILAVVLTFCLLLGAVYTGVSAEEPTSYSLESLVNGGSVKTLGRTRLENGALVADWPATGFEINISVPTGGTEFTVNVNSNYSVYVDIIVDGDYGDGAYTRTITNANVASATKTIGEGTHTVRVIRDTQPSSNTEYVFAFESISFSGDILAAPAENDLYVEFVGDSYSCGDGAAALYVPGQKWTEPADDSIIESFTYRAALQMGADYSIIARGGIGLTGTDVQQVAGKSRINELYNYVASERDYQSQAEEYDFARKPDFVVVEIGANDGQSASVIDTWKERASAFISQIREKYNDPELPIVWVTTGSNYKHYLYMTALGESDPNLYAVRYYQGGNGSAALATQEAGHPSATQQRKWGEDLVKYLESVRLYNYTPKTPVNETAKENTVAVYVDGASGGDGSRESPFTYVKDAESALAERVAALSGGNDNIDAVIYLSDAQSDCIYSNASSATNSSLTGQTTVVKDADGNGIMVQIVGLDTNGDGVYPTWAVSHYSSNWRKAVNSYRFENIRITGSGDGANGAFSQLYCFGKKTVFDKGTTVWQSSTSAQNSAEGLTTLYGGSASNSNSVTTATKGRAETGSDITINSDAIKITNVYAGGIGAYGAYTTTTVSGKATTDLSLWKYDAYTKDVSLNLTINAGTFTNVAVGSSSFIGGKRLTSNITVNGGNITNLYGSVNASGNYSKIQYFDSIVNINGGQIDDYVAASGEEVTYNGTVTTNINGGVLKGDYYGTATGVQIGTINFNMNSGSVECVTFATVGESAVAENVNTVINGGEIITRATTSSQGIFFGGYNSAKNTNVNTTITGGKITLIITTASASTSLWFGGRSSVEITNLNNTVTGGVIAAYFADGITSTSGTCGIYLGNYSGKIGKLTNRIEGGLFDLGPISTGSYIFGSQAVSNAIGSMENTLGVAGTDLGPTFLSRNTYIGSNWSKIGADSTAATQPSQSTDCSDEIILRNKIEYGTFTGMVYLGTMGVPNTTNKYWVFVKGSMESEINGGQFRSDLYCGAGRVYGSVKTTINGGIFKNVYGYGTGSASSRTYDGTELTINGFTSYGKATGTDYFVYAGSNSAAVAAPVTAGKPAIKLTVNGGDIASYLYGGSNTGAVTGNIVTEINGGNISKAVYGGSNTGTVTGNITNTVNGGMFSASLYGGSNSGNIDGHVSTLIANKTGKMHNVYGGSPTGNITDGIELNITHFMTNGDDKTVMAGSIEGDISLKPDSAYENAVSLNVYAENHSDKANLGDVSIDGSVFVASNKGNITGNVYAHLSGGNNDNNSGVARHLVLGNQYRAGKIDGNITVDMERGAYYGGTLYLGHRTAIADYEGEVGITGNVTLNMADAHIGTVVEPNVTVDGQVTVNVDLDKGTANTIINNKLGDSSKYNFNLTGGKNRIFLTANTKLFPDTADISSEKPLNIHQYSNWVDGTVYARLPGQVTDHVNIFSGSTVTGKGAVMFNGTTNKTVVFGANTVIGDGLNEESGVTEEQIAAQFELTEALAVKILFPETVVNSAIAAVGSFDYEIAFLGDTYAGSFNSESVAESRYYATEFNVPTGKFAEKITVKCDLSEKATQVTVNDILDAGSQQYEGNIKTLFEKIKDYGAQAAALFENAAAPGTVYDDAEIASAIENYYTSISAAKKNHIKGTNLLLKDKVNVQFYMNVEDISSITKAELNGTELTQQQYTITATDALEGCNYLISVAVDASQMADSINLKLYEGETVCDDVTVSIAAYCKTYIESQNEIYKKYSDISKALLRYIANVDIVYNS